MSCERTGKVPRIATAIATSPSHELFVLFSNGELWLWSYKINEDTRQQERIWERLEIPNPPDA